MFIWTSVIPIALAPGGRDGEPPPIVVGEDRPTEKGRTSQES
jgi:hypothetical protein